jgi:predicted transcriptional regulator
LAYVQALRVEEAKQMLETGSAPVDVIAREVGYEDSASFRRLFRRLAGMTPGEYRRRFQVPSFVKQAATERKPKRPQRAPKGAARRPARDAGLGARDERAAPRH